MNYFTTTDTELTSVANAIKNKLGISGQLTYPDEFISAINSISGGSVTENDVNFYDYDGKLLYSYTASDFLALSEYPDNPSHSGLTAQGWNWTLQNAQDYVSQYGKIEIGQSYITDDGKTRLYIYIQNECDLSTDITFTASVDQGIEIDWGDSSETELSDGTERKIYNHVYSAVGSYLITLNVLDGELIIGDPSSTSQNYSAPIMGTISSGHGPNVYKLYKVELGSDIAKLYSSSFMYMHGLETITIPNSIDEICSYSFYWDAKLKALVIPHGVQNVIGVETTYNKSLEYCILSDTVTNFNFTKAALLKKCTIPATVTSLPNRCFDETYNLQTLIIPDSVTEIGQYVFNYSGAQHIQLSDSITSISKYAFSASYVRSITVPEGVTSIEEYAFYNCKFLSVVILPSTITEIKGAAFRADCIKEVHIGATTPPSYSTYAVEYGSVYVPYSSDHSVLNAYKAANGWSGISNRIYEEPQ